MQQLHESLESSAEPKLSYLVLGHLVLCTVVYVLCVPLLHTLTVMLQDHDSAATVLSRELYSEFPFEQTTKKRKISLKPLLLMKACCVICRTKRRTARESRPF